MKIQRSGSQPSAKGPSDWFTDTVRLDPLLQTEALDGKAVEWMEKVTDEQYSRRSR
jgi:hypothetical protein